MAIELRIEQLINPWLASEPPLTTGTSDGPSLGSSYVDEEPLTSWQKLYGQLLPKKAEPPRAKAPQRVESPSLPSPTALGAAAHLVTQLDDESRAAALQLASDRRRNLVATTLADNGQVGPAMLSEWDLQTRANAARLHARALVDQRNNGTLSGAQYTKEMGTYLLATASAVVATRGAALAATGLGASAGAWNLGAEAWLDQRRAANMTNARNQNALVPPEQLTWKTAMALGELLDDPAMGYLLESTALPSGMTRDGALALGSRPVTVKIGPNMQATIGPKDYTITDTDKGKGAHTGAGASPRPARPTPVDSGLSPAQQLRWDSVRRSGDAAEVTQFYNELPESQQASVLTALQSDAYSVRDRQIHADQWRGRPDISDAQRQFVATADAEKVRVDAEFATHQAEYAAGLSIATNLLGFKNPEAARLVGGIGQSALQIADMAHKLKTSSGYGALLASADLLSVGLFVVGLFANPGPSPDQLLMEAIGNVSEQVTGLQEQVTQLSRDVYDVRVEVQTVRKEMHQQFAQLGRALQHLSHGQAIMQGQLSQVMASLSAVQAEVDRLQLQDYLTRVQQAMRVSGAGASKLAPEELRSRLRDLELAQGDLIDGPLMSQPTLGAILWHKDPADLWGIALLQPPAAQVPNPAFWSDIVSATYALYHQYADVVPRLGMKSSVQARRDLRTAIVPFQTLSNTLVDGLPAQIALQQQLRSYYARYADVLRALDAAATAFLYQPLSGGSYPLAVANRRIAGVSLLAPWGTALIGAYRDGLTKANEAPAVRDITPFTPPALEATQLAAVPDEYLMHDLWNIGALKFQYTAEWTPEPEDWRTGRLEVEKKRFESTMQMVCRPRVGGEDICRDNPAYPKADARYHAVQSLELGLRYAEFAVWSGATLVTRWRDGVQAGDFDVRQRYNNALQAIKRGEDVRFAGVVERSSLDAPGTVWNRAQTTALAKMPMALTGGDTQTQMRNAVVARQTQLWSAFLAHCTAMVRADTTVFVPPTDDEAQMVAEAADLVSQRYRYAVSDAALQEGSGEHVAATTPEDVALRNALRELEAVRRTLIQSTHIALGVSATSDPALQQRLSAVEGLPSPSMLLAMWAQMTPADMARERDAIVGAAKTDPQAAYDAQVTHGRIGDSATGVVADRVRALDRWYRTYVAQADACVEMQRTAGVLYRLGQRVHPGLVPYSFEEALRCESFTGRAQTHPVVQSGLLLLDQWAREDVRRADAAAARAAAEESDRTLPGRLLVSAPLGLLPFVLYTEGQQRGWWSAVTLN